MYDDTVQKFLSIPRISLVHMQARDKSLTGKAISGISYHAIGLFIRMSRLPYVGRFIEGLVSRGRLRVVTVGIKMQSDPAILPYDVVKRLIEEASYLAAADHCICRSSQGCKDYPKDLGCLYLGEGARGIRYKTREVTKAEALERLERARSLGLVNNIIWSADEFRLLGADRAHTVEVCSCCPCCCLMFKARDASRAFIDGILGLGVCKVTYAEGCSRCTNCERACPFKAITVDMQGGPSVDEARCKGCGRCEAVCRGNVLKVFPKPDRDAISGKYGQSNANVGELVERFLAMVK